MAPTGMIFASDPDQKPTLKNDKLNNFADAANDKDELWELVEEIEADSPCSDIVPGEAESTCCYIMPDEAEETVNDTIIESLPPKTDEEEAENNIVLLKDAVVSNSARTMNEAESTQQLDLHTEADLMLDISLLIYTYAQIRQFARKSAKRYIGEERLLDDEEITGKEILEYAKSNKDVLRKDLKNDHKTSYYYQTLLNLVNRFDKAKNVWTYQEQIKVAKMQEAKVVVFDDKDAKTEIVHGITVNEEAKRIAIVFRGSATPYDWFKKFQVSTTVRPNPLRGKPYQPEEIALHHGYSDYLLNPNDEGGTSKYENIVTELKALCTQYPGFSVYCTGHSLGGALSTLAAFYLAIESDTVIPKPIRCISVASPMLGDWRWRNAFMWAEKEGLLRQLRITNDGDIVPRVPTISILTMTTYKHVGLHLRFLETSGQHRFSYPKDGNSDEQDIASNNLINFLRSDVLEKHSAIEYDRNMNLCSAALLRCNLDYMYKDRSLVGDYKNLTEEGHKSIESDITSLPICLDLIHKY